MTYVGLVRTEIRTENDKGTVYSEKDKEDDKIEDLGRFQERKGPDVVKDNKKEVLKGIIGKSLTWYCKSSMKLIYIIEKQ